MFWPQDGAIYQYVKTGNLYRVLFVARAKLGAELLVVYQSLDGTMPWTRPISEFGERFRYVRNVD